MQINSINQGYTTNFKRKNENETGGAGKAWASAFVPGLGQFLDDRNEQGALFLGGMVGLKVLHGYLFQDAIKTTKRIINTSTKNGTLICRFRGGYEGVGALGLCTFGLWLVNIVDAYKGDRKKSHSIDVPKNDVKNMEQEKKELENIKEIKKLKKEIKELDKSISNKED